MSYDDPRQTDVQPEELVGSSFLVTALATDEIQTANGLKRYVDSTVTVIEGDTLEGVECRWWQSHPVKQLAPRVGNSDPLLVRLEREEKAPHAYRFHPATEKVRKLADAYLEQHPEPPPF